MFSATFLATAGKLGVKIAHVLTCT